MNQNPTSLQAQIQELHLLLKEARFEAIAYKARYESETIINNRLKEKFQQQEKELMDVWKELGGTLADLQLAREEIKELRGN